MEFEYDPVKSEANLVKHGIDFEEAQELWGDPGMIQARSQHPCGEERIVAIAQLGGSCWTAVFTVRGHRVRIISVRRSTPKEASAYGKANS